MIEKPGLSYVALVTKDASRAEHLLGEVLGLPRRTVPADGDTMAVFAVGQSVLALFPPGHAYVDGETKTGVHHIGLAYAGELPALPVMGSPVPALGGGTRQAIDPMHTAGVRCFLTQPLGGEPGTSRLIERIDHLGIASADNQVVVPLFSGQLGLPIESQQTDMEVETAVESFTSDKYGVVYHARAPRVAGGLRVAFLTAGDCELEFLQNFDPSHGASMQGGAAGTTRQDQGAITGFIARRGAGLHHVALKSPDINATLAALGQAGATMIDYVGRPGSRRALIGFVHPSSFGGVLFHVVQRD